MLHISRYCPEYGNDPDIGISSRFALPKCGLNEFPDNRNSSKVGEIRLEAGVLAGFDSNDGN